MNQHGMATDGAFKRQQQPKKQHRVTNISMSLSDWLTLLSSMRRRQLRLDPYGKPTNYPRGKVQEVALFE